MSKSNDAYLLSLKHPIKLEEYIMTDNELRRMSRAGLLEILLAQSREIERLKDEVAALNERLEDRDILMSRSGSLAEASLQINHVFEAAQRAADQYVSSVKSRFSA